MESDLGPKTRPGDGCPDGFPADCAGQTLGVANLDPSNEQSEACEGSGGGGGVQRQGPGSPHPGWDSPSLSRGPAPKPLTAEATECGRTFTPEFPGPRAGPTLGGDFRPTFLEALTAWAHRWEVASRWAHALGGTVGPGKLVWTRRTDSEATGQRTRFWPWDPPGLPPASPCGCSPRPPERQPPAPAPPPGDSDPPQT